MAVALTRTAAACKGESLKAQLGMAQGTPARYDQPRRRRLWHATSLVLVPAPSPSSPHPGTRPLLASQPPCRSSSPLLRPIFVRATGTGPASRSGAAPALRDWNSAINQPPNYNEAYNGPARCDSVSSNHRCCAERRRVAGARAPGGPSRRAVGGTCRRLLGHSSSITLSS